MPKGEEHERNYRDEKDKDRSHIKRYWNEEDVADTNPTDESRNRGRDRYRRRRDSRSRSQEHLSSRQREKNYSTKYRGNDSRGKENLRDVEPTSLEKEDRIVKRSHPKGEDDEYDVIHKKTRNDSESEGDESVNVRKLGRDESVNVRKPEEDEKRKPILEDVLTRTGGAYIPPARLKLMQKDFADKSSVAYQRIAWEALKKSINGLINKINTSNVPIIVRELLKENLVRGRGVLCRSIMQAQSASPTFTNVYAALIAIINTKFPNIGELILKRLIIQFRRGYKRNDKPACLAAASFIGHLVNQEVAHEVLALEILTLLLEHPTEDSVQVAISFLKEVGARIDEVSPKGAHFIFERLRNVLNEANLDKRVQYMIEVMFQVRKDKFKDFIPVPEELDLVEEEEQFTHLLTLDEATDGQDILNVFKADPEYISNEEKYTNLRKEILDESDEDEEGEEVEEGEEDEEGEVVDKGIILDKTETNLLGLRKTIYLTIQSSLDFEECCHKLLKMNMQEGQEIELCHMILDCCAQQRTYEKFFGLLAGRFCVINIKYVTPFESIFKDTYETVHRLDTNKLRNVSKFFAHLLFTDSFSWGVLQCIRLTEEDTTSSSRIFVKILFQELSEYMGLNKLNERITDPSLGYCFEGLFPRDHPKNTRFAINFFTSIGLGGLTDELREHLKKHPKPTAVVAPQITPSETLDSKKESSSDSDSSSSSSDDDSSSDSSSSSSTSSESEDSETNRNNSRNKNPRKHYESQHERRMALPGRENDHHQRHQELIQRERDYSHSERQLTPLSHDDMSRDPARHQRDREYTRADGVHVSSKRNRSKIERDLTPPSGKHTSTDRGRHQRDRKLTPVDREHKSRSRARSKEERRMTPPDRESDHYQRRREHVQRTHDHSQSESQMTPSSREHMSRDRTRYHRDREYSTVDVIQNRHERPKKVSDLTPPTHEHTFTDRVRHQRDRELTPVDRDHISSNLERYKDERRMTPPDRESDHHHRRREHIPRKRDHSKNERQMTPPSREHMSGDPVRLPRDRELTPVDREQKSRNRARSKEELRVTPPDRESDHHQRRREHIQRKRDHSQSERRMTPPRREDISRDPARHHRDREYSPVDGVPVSKKRDRSKEEHDLTPPSGKHTSTERVRLHRDRELTPGDRENKSRNRARSKEKRHMTPEFESDHHQKRREHIPRRRDHSQSERKMTRPSREHISRDPTCHHRDREYSPVDGVHVSNKRDRSKEEHDLTPPRGKHTSNERVRLHRDRELTREDRENKSSNRARSKEKRHMSPPDRESDHHHKRGEHIPRKCDHSQSERQMTPASRQHKSRDPVRHHGDRELTPVDREEKSSKRARSKEESPETPPDRESDHHQRRREHISRKRDHSKSERQMTPPSREHTSNDPARHHRDSKYSPVDGVHVSSKRDRSKKERNLTSPNRKNVSTDRVRHQRDRE